MQAAVTHNAESVKGLATQWKDTMESIDSAAGRLQKEVNNIRTDADVAPAVRGRKLKSGRHIHYGNVPRSGFIPK